jgi:hypothetical protein
MPLACWAWAWVSSCWPSSCELDRRLGAPCTAANSRGVRRLRLTPAHRRPSCCVQGGVRPTRAARLPHDQARVRLLHMQL